MKGTNSKGRFEYGEGASGAFRRRGFGGQREALAEGRARSGRAVYGHRGRIGARGRDQNR